MVSIAMVSIAIVGRVCPLPHRHTPSPTSTLPLPLLLLLLLALLLLLLLLLALTLLFILILRLTLTLAPTLTRHADCLAALLRAGADPDARRNDGTTSVH